MANDHMVPDEGLFTALQRRSMNKEIIILLGSADLMLLPLLQASLLPQPTCVQRDGAIRFHRPGLSEADRNIPMDEPSWHE